MSIMDRDKRYLMDNLKVGRSGKSFYIWGAPEDMKGPYPTHQEANAVYESILNHVDDYKVVAKGPSREESIAMKH